MNRFKAQQCAETYEQSVLINNLIDNGPIRCLYRNKWTVSVANPRAGVRPWSFTFFYPEWVQLRKRLRAAGFTVTDTDRILKLTGGGQ